MNKKPRFFLSSYHYLSLPVYKKLNQKLEVRNIYYLNHNELSTKQVNKNQFLPLKTLSRKTIFKSFGYSRLVSLIDAFFFILWLLKLIRDYRPSVIYSVGGSLHYLLAGKISELSGISFVVIQPCLLDFENKLDFESKLSRFSNFCMQRLFGLTISNRRVLFGTEYANNVIWIWQNSLKVYYEKLNIKMKLISIFTSKSYQFQKNTSKFLFCFESMNEFSQRYPKSSVEKYFELVLKINKKFGQDIVWRTHPRVEQDYFELVKLIGDEILIDQEINIEDLCVKYTGIISINSSISIHAALSGSLAINLLITDSQKPMGMYGLTDNIIDVNINDLEQIICKYAIN